MLTLNKERVEKLLSGLAEFGKTEHGITRLAYTQLDRDAQNWLLKEIEDLDVTVHEDAVGNLFLRKQGSSAELAPVACGSHLDTVICGGAYDGMCGVVGGIEVLYMLADEKLPRSIDVIVFRAEESSRFGFATIGSKLLTGSGKPEDFNKASKKGDVSFMEALKAWGCSPEKYQEAVLGKDAYKCFAEMHIEQGKVLETENYQLGIVHNIAAPTRFKVHFYGLADHSGATPMGMRKDALVSGAKMILAINEAATAEKEYGTVATVGVVDVEPGSINVVPGAVTLWVDLRGVNEASISRTLEQIKNQAEKIAAADNIDFDMKFLTADQPVALDEALAGKLETICREKGYTCLHMNSGAGHDAMHMAKITPATMLFIPCKDGISHNKDEYADINDICRGVEVLAEFLKQEASA